MSSPALKEIIDIGYDMRGSKFYVAAAATVFFYDYFLTLADEIEYAWHGRKSWVFTIFLVNRYVPMAYQVWLLYMDFSPTFPQQLCNKTAFFSGFTFVFSTFLAQVVLTLRIYAVSRENRIITVWLGAVTVSQFILGLCFTRYGATHGGKQIPLPVDAYKICVLSRHRPMELGYTTLSLVYDLTAFSLIVYLVLVRSNGYQRRMPLLKTIAQDATYYFLIIFTSHFVLELTLLFARPSLQLIPASGNVVFLPVMIARLMLSLKKVNASQEGTSWSLGRPTIQTARFANDTSDTGDVIFLDTIASTSEGVTNRA